MGPRCAPPGHYVTQGRVEVHRRRTDNQPETHDCRYEVPASDPIPMKPKRTNRTRTTWRRRLGGLALTFGVFPACGGGAESPSSPTPPPPAILEPRFRLTVKPGYAYRYQGTPGVGPGFTSYGACHFIENYAPFKAWLTYTITPLGSDGRDYPVVQTVFQGPQSSASPISTRSGCAGGEARDFNLAHPVAVAYRYRVDYVYDDGVTGYAEGQSEVILRRDEIGSP